MDTINKYVGERKDGLMHGQGTFTFDSGDKYVGEFMDGRMNGQGTYTFADGDKYVGEFMDGLMHGQGTYTKADGGKYVGEFKGGHMHGQGTRIYATGGKYVGEFMDGRMNGQGTFTFDWGDKFEGEWKDGKQQGQGTRIYATGDKYVGEFKDGKKHGNGTFTWANGTVEKGVWKEDVFELDAAAEERLKAKIDKMDKDALENNYILNLDPNTDCKIYFTYTEEWRSCYYQYKKDSEINLDPNTLPVLDSEYLQDTGEPLFNDNNEAVYDPSQDIEYEYGFKVELSSVYSSKSIIRLLQEKIKDLINKGELAPYSSDCGSSIAEAVGATDQDLEAAIDQFFDGIGCHDFEQIESANGYDKLLWCTSSQLDGYFDFWIE